MYHKIEQTPPTGPLRTISSHDNNVFEFDQFNRVYQEAVSLAATMRSKLQFEIDNNADMNAIDMTYRWRDVRKGCGDPPVPSDDVDFIGSISVRRITSSPQSPHTFMKRIIIQRPNDKEAASWLQALDMQKLVVVNSSKIDLNNPGKLETLVRSFFMIPSDLVYDRISQNCMMAQILSGHVAEEIMPLNLLGKMNMHLPWLVQGAQSWGPIVEKL